MMDHTVSSGSVEISEMSLNAFNPKILFIAIKEKNEKESLLMKERQYAIVATKRMLFCGMRDRKKTDLK